MKSNETLVAKGKYTCYRDGLNMLSGVVEYWTIHKLSDGSQIIRCDRQAERGDSGMQVQGMMLNALSGQTKHMEMKIFVYDELVAEATYNFEQDQVHIVRRTLVARKTYSDYIETTMPLPKGYLVDFHRMSISLGFIVRDSANLLEFSEEVDNIRMTIINKTSDNSPRGVPVFYPSNLGGYFLRYEPEHLLTGNINYYKATLIEKNIPTDVGEKIIKADLYQLMMVDNTGFGFGYRVLVDQHGIAVRNGGGYVFYLTEYERF